MNPETLHPLGSHILARKIPFTRTTGGIELPPSMSDDHNTGGCKLLRVLATGPGQRLKNGEYPAPEIWPGDRILCQYLDSGPDELGPDLAILTQNQVLAVLPKDQPDH